MPSSLSETGVSTAALTGGKVETAADYDKGRKLIDGLKAHIGHLTEDHQNGNKDAEQHLGDIVRAGDMASSVLFAQHRRGRLA